jgi:uncharacterized membrane protein
VKSSPTVTLLGAARWAGVGAVCVGYAVLAHFASADPSPDLLDASVAMAPLVALSLALAWRSSRRHWMLLVCLAGCVAVYFATDWLVQHHNWVFLLQHVGMQALLGLAFGTTLRTGQMPLVSRLAALVHGQLSPALARYTRQVTWAWTLYFSAMAVASLLLFWLAPVAVWSIFANLLGIPLLILMFIAEYAVRLCLLAPSERTGPLQAIRAYLQATPGAMPPAS